MSRALLHAALSSSLPAPDAGSENDDGLRYLHGSNFLSSLSEEEGSERQLRALSDSVVDVNTAVHGVRAIGMLSSDPALLRSVRQECDALASPEEQLRHFQEVARGKTEKLSTAPTPVRTPKHSRCAAFIGHQQR